MKLMPAIILAGCLFVDLAGCALPAPPKAHATADQVLTAQYRARADHGAMSGAEASIVTDFYRRNISVTPAGTMSAGSDPHEATTATH